MPLGNVTSQIFANIYLNELDWFIKRKLCIKSYFRYADDFIITHPDKEYLLCVLKEIKVFLETELNLQLHPKKVSIRKFHRGVDFLGYVILPHYKVLRTKTKKRMYRKLKEKYIQYQCRVISQEKFKQSLQSYLGMLKHCKGRTIKEKIIDLVKNK